ncbi:MAG: hypothetical protein LBN02_10290 [Oscillospiraceae bacterium]|jgi:hypothetical protein|nr:hypothetical protein [Oscillospiraceae bacterium]
MKTRFFVLVVAVALLATMFAGCSKEPDTRKDDAIAYIDSLIAATTSAPDTIVPAEGDPEIMGAMKTYDINGYSFSTTGTVFIKDHATLEKLKTYITNSKDFGDVGAGLSFPYLTPAAIANARLYYCDGKIYFHTTKDAPKDGGAITYFNVDVSDAEALRVYCENVLNNDIENVLPGLFEDLENANGVFENSLLR